jgi:NADH-quinone oxidoreductase subunit C
MSADVKNRLPAELAAIPAKSRTAQDYPRTGCHALLAVDSGTLRPAVQQLFDRGYFLEDITGVDVVEGILLLYHFDHYASAQRLALRLIVPRAVNAAPSIAAIFSGADWHERECFDFFGVQFEGHPGLKPLLLPDDLGIHPLLKERGRKSLFGLLPLGQMMEEAP